MYSNSRKHSLSESVASSTSSLHSQKRRRIVPNTPVPTKYLYRASSPASANARRPVNGDEEQNTSQPRTSDMACGRSSVGSIDGARMDSLSQAMGPGDNRPAKESVIPESPFARVLFQRRDFPVSYTGRSVFRSSTGSYTKPNIAAFIKRDTSRTPSRLSVSRIGSMSPPPRPSSSASQRLLSASTWNSVIPSPKLNRSQSSLGFSPTPEDLVKKSDGILTFIGSALSKAKAALTEDRELRNEERKKRAKEEARIRLEEEERRRRDVLFAEIERQEKYHDSQFEIHASPASTSIVAALQTSGHMSTLASDDTLPNVDCAEPQLSKGSQPRLSAILPLAIAETVTEAAAHTSVMLNDSDQHGRFNTSIPLQRGILPIRQQQQQRETVLQKATEMSNVVVLLDSEDEENSPGPNIIQHPSQKVLGYNDTGGDVEGEESSEGQYGHGTEEYSEEEYGEAFEPDGGTEDVGEEQESEKEGETEFDIDDEEVVLSGNDELGQSSVEMIELEEEEEEEEHEVDEEVEVNEEDEMENDEESQDVYIENCLEGDRAVRNESNVSESTGNGGGRLQDGPEGPEEDEYPKVSERGLAAEALQHTENPEAGRGNMHMGLQYGTGQQILTDSRITDVEVVSAEDGSGHAAESCTRLSFGFEGLQADFHENRDIERRPPAELYVDEVVEMRLRRFENEQERGGIEEFIEEEEQEGLDFTTNVDGSHEGAVIEEEGGRTEDRQLVSPASEDCCFFRFHDTSTKQLTSKRVPQQRLSECAEGLDTPESAPGRPGIPVDPVLLHDRQSIVEEQIENPESTKVNTGLPESHNAVAVEIEENVRRDSVVKYSIVEVTEADEGAGTPRIADSIVSRLDTEETESVSHYEEEIMWEENHCSTYDKDDTQVVEVEIIENAITIASKSIPRKGTPDPAEKTAGNGNFEVVMGNDMHVAPTSPPTSVEESSNELIVLGDCENPVSQTPTQIRDSKISYASRQEAYPSSAENPIFPSRPEYMDNSPEMTPSASVSSTVVLGEQHSSPGEPEIFGLRRTESIGPYHHKERSSSHSPEPFQAKLLLSCKSRRHKKTRKEKGYESKLLSTPKKKRRRVSDTAGKDIELAHPMETSADEGLQATDIEDSQELIAQRDYEDDVEEKTQEELVKNIPLSFEYDHEGGIELRDGKVVPHAVSGITVPSEVGDQDTSLVAMKDGKLRRSPVPVDVAIGKALRDGKVLAPISTRRTPSATPSISDSPTTGQYTTPRRRKRTNSVTSPISETFTESLEVKSLRSRDVLLAQAGPTAEESQGNTEGKDNAQTQMEACSKPAIQQRSARSRKRSRI